MINKILVPTDFSEFAENALQLAVQIAKKTTASIHLLHVVEAPSTQSFNTLGMQQVSEMEQSFHKELLDVVEKKIQELAGREEFAGVKIEPQVFIGHPYHNISKHIVENEADLVIMGTRGKSGLEEMIIGSTTEKVVRFAECPVISIPKMISLDDIKQLVFATNLSNSFDKTVEVLKEFQDLCQATINLLWVHAIHVVESEERMIEKLQEFASRNGLSNYKVEVRKNITVEGGVMNFAEEINADLIVMATHGRQGLAHIFSGSLAEEIVNHSKRPVLTVSLKKQ